MYSLVSEFEIRFMYFCCNQNISLIFSLGIQWLFNDVSKHVNQQRVWSLGEFNLKPLATWGAASS